MPLYINPKTGEQYQSEKDLSPNQLDELFNVDVPPVSSKMPAEDPVGNWLSGITGGKPPSQLGPADFRARDAVARVAPQAIRDVAATGARVGIPLAGAVTGGPVGGAIGGLVGGGLGNLIQGQEPTPGGMAADTAMGALAVAPVKAATTIGAIAKGAALGGASVTIDSVLRDQELPKAGRVALGTIIGGAMAGGVNRLEMRSALNEVMPADQADIVQKILTKQKISEAEFQGSQSAKEAVKEIHAVQDSPILNQFGKPFEHQAIIPESNTLPVENPITSTKPHPATAVSQPITPPKFFFDRLQTQTNNQVFDEVWYPLHEASTASNHQLVEVGRDLQHVFKGLTSSSALPRRAAITKWMQADEAGQATLENSMDKSDVGRGLQLQQMMRDHFAKAGLNWDKFFKDQLPQLAGAGSVKEAFPVEIPKEIQYFRSALDNEFIGPAETDALGIVGKLSKQVIRKETLDPVIKDVQAKYIGKGLNSSVESPIKELITNIEGHRDQMHTDLSRFWQYVRSTPILNKLTRAETQDHANTLLGLQYGGTMAGRIPPLVKNAQQTAITGFMYLGKWYPTGIKKALSKEGYQFAVSSGALGAEEGLGSEMSAMMGTESRIAKIIRWGFKPYRAVDEYNRAIMFHGGYEKVLDAASRSSGDVKKFVDLADLDVGFAQAEAVRIGHLFATGQVKEAARQYGIALADNTQFMYTMGDKIPITTGSTLKQVAGAYNNWPLWYMHLLKNAVAGPGSWQKKGIVLGRWAAANGAIALAVGALAKTAGIPHPWISSLGYVGLGPAIFGIAPGLQLLQKTSESISGVVRGKQGLGSAIKTEAKALKPFVPYYSAMQDQIRTIKTTQDRGFGEAVLNATGLTPYQPKR